MITVALSILFSTITVSFFKLFERYKVDTLQAIIANYITCILLGLFLMNDSSITEKLKQFTGYEYTLFLGFLFISIFLSIAKTAQTISVSASMVAAKLSVVIPVVASVFLYNEALSMFKMAGIILSLIAVWFISNKDEDAHLKDNKYLLLPLIVFIGSGLIDTMLKLMQSKFIPPLNEALIVTLVFANAFAFGVLYLSYQTITGKTTINLKSLVWGVFLGLPNYFSMFFLVKTLTLFDASMIFPINNIGIVGLSTFAGIWFFNEKLNNLNKAGLVLAILSIIVISLF
ncbi:MAG: EamA/RhaT family transporter [Bacteroidia bacterium]